MRLFVALFLLLAVASNGVAQQRSPVIVQLRGFDSPIRLETVATWNDVLQGPGQAFTAVRRVVDSLKIPIVVADSARGLIHNPGFTARRNLAGKQMSRLIHCGMGVAGDYADSYLITIAYAVMVDSLPDGHSRVGIALVSNGRDVAGVSTETLMCGTTGALEQTIIKSAQLELLKGRPPAP